VPQEFTTGWKRRKEQRKKQRKKEQIRKLDNTHSVMEKEYWA
jgi:hypothetical protein